MLKLLLVELGSKNEKLSTSLGLRAVYGLRTLEASTSNKNLSAVGATGTASIDSERTGYGFGFQFRA